MEMFALAILLAASAAPLLAQTAYPDLQDDTENWYASSVGDAGNTADCDVSFVSDPQRPGHNLVVLSMTNAVGTSPICALIYKGLPLQDPAITAGRYFVQSVAWVDPAYKDELFAVAGELLRTDNQGVSKMALQSRFEGLTCEGARLSFAEGAAYAWGHAYCGSLGYVTFYSDDAHTGRIATAETANPAVDDVYNWAGDTYANSAFESECLWVPTNVGCEYAGLGAAKTQPVAGDPAPGQVLIRYTVQSDNQAPQQLTVGNVRMTM